MSYPGNTSLAPEIQNRILSTFRQTIELAEKGRLQEARLGCEFILKMDSQFGAARKLRERLEGASGPVKASDLEIGTAAAAPAAAAPTPRPPAASAAAASRPAPAEPVRVPDPFGDLGGPAGAGLDLDLDLGGDFGDLDLEDAVPARTPSADEDAFPHLGGGASDPPGSMFDETPIAESSAGPSSGGFAGEEPEPVGASAAPVAGLAAEPAPPAPAGSGNPRIDELLREGQAAFDQDEYQAAIDAWSRIFLIDIDHEDAGSRIEEARALKAERERQGDELLDEATRARDEGRLDDARHRLEGLLAEQPENLAARDLLEQIQTAEGGGAALAAGPAATQAPAAAEEGVLQAELPPARQRPASPAPAFPGGAGKSRGGGRSLQMVGGAVFLLVIVLAWFLYTNWGSLFPNAVVEETVPAAPPGASPLRRANQLRLDGNLGAAIEVLKGVPADHPEAGQARTLLDQLEAEVAEAAAAEAAAAERDATLQASRQQLLEEARRAYDERRYLEAAKTFRAADDLQPLEGAAADLYRDTRQQLLPIAQQIDLFRQREWRQVLPTLWRKLEEEPDNRDARRVLVDSYYNLAIQDLRRGDAGSALDSLQEVVGLDAEDALAGRLVEFALSYQERPVDLLYRIFVGQLEFRK
jgi:hypothetical protein